jgi:hypothetical protein
MRLEDTWEKGGRDSASIVLHPDLDFPGACFGLDHYRSFFGDGGPGVLEEIDEDLP